MTVPAHPVVLPALLAVGVAVATYETITHLGRKSPAPSGAKPRLSSGTSRSLTPGTGPAGGTTKPQVLSQPWKSSKLKNTPSNVAPEDNDNGGGSSDSDDSSTIRNLSNTAPPSLPAATPSNAAPPSPSPSNDGGGGASPDDNDNGGGSGDGGGPAPDDGSGDGGDSSGDGSGDGSGDDASFMSDAESAVSSALGSGAASGGGDLLSGAASALSSVFGPFSGARRSGRVGAISMNPIMQWHKYQWVTLQPQGVNASDIPPPPHVKPSSGAWQKYPEGMAFGPPSFDPRSYVYPDGLHGPVPPPAPASINLDDYPVNFRAYQNVPHGMNLFAWRPTTGTTDKVNGFWIYGLGQWSVRPPNTAGPGGTGYFAMQGQTTKGWQQGPEYDSHPDGSPVFDAGKQIPDPPGSVFDSFWQKMFNGSYDVVKHTIPGSDAILRSLGIPAGHDGGHWALVAPGYAVWLDFHNTATDFTPPLESWPIPMGPSDPARFAKIQVMVPGQGVLPSPQEQFDVNVQAPGLDVNVDESGNLAQGGYPVAAATSVPDVVTASMQPMLPPPWAAQATYVPGEEYAASLPPSVVPFPPPSIPLGAQSLLAQAAAQNAVAPTPAGGFEEGFAEASADDAAAVAQPQEVQMGQPDYSVPGIDPNPPVEVCTLPDGTLGVWCDLIALDDGTEGAWTPYYPGVEADAPPPEGIPAYPDDGGGPGPAPIAVCTLPTGELGVWVDVEDGWMNYYPGCEFSSPPPGGAPVFSSSGQAAA